MYVWGCRSLYHRRHLTLGHDSLGYAVSRDPGLEHVLGGRGAYLARGPQRRQIRVIYGAYRRYAFF